MSTIAVKLPEPLAERLREEKVPVEEAIIEALEEWLERRREGAESERERVREAIERAGLHLKTSWEEWDELFASTAAEVRRMMTGVSPLSEDIIAERDEGR